MVVVDGHIQEVDMVEGVVSVDVPPDWTCQSGTPDWTCQSGRCWVHPDAWEPSERRSKQGVWWMHEVVVVCVVAWPEPDSVQ